MIEEWIAVVARAKSQKDFLSTCRIARVWRREGEREREREREGERASDFINKESCHTTNAQPTAQSIVHVFIHSNLSAMHVHTLP